MCAGDHTRLASVGTLLVIIAEGGREGREGIPIGAGEQRAGSGIALDLVGLSLLLATPRLEC